MRNQKDAWSFYKVEAKPRLTADQVHYWKQQMHKIAKVGCEFEFNLPDKKTGTCKGDSNTCPCMRMTPDNDCWQQCANKDNCGLATEKINTCSVRTETCEPGDCLDCTIYAGECVGITCPNFVTYCLVCSNFEKECKGCRYKFDPNKNPDAIRSKLNEELQPGGSYGQYSESGVHNITTDGSLLGKKGVEIITVGRRVDYWEFYRMSKNIIDRAVSRGAYLNERCSIHMHLLGAYFGKLVPHPSGSTMKVNEMERSMPQIIMANFHQLVRRYQNAMTWMMMGLPEENRMTRWEKFRVSVLGISAVMSSMEQVKQQVASNSGGNKYGWANYNNLSFDRKGDINRFHVEMRACDGLLSPSAVAAIACMYHALLIKAIEISRYGVVEVGDAEWMDQAQEVKEALLNNMKGYQDGDRFCDTSRLAQYYDILITQSLDLVRQLKPILIKLGPAYEVLEKLAERPCSTRLVAGQSWEQIEKDLEVIVTEQGALEIALCEIIDLQHVRECQTQDEWVNEVGRILREDPELGIDKNDNTVEETIEVFIEGKKDGGEMVWSQPVGAPIFV
jgi:hypothetical protein